MISQGLNALIEQAEAHLSDLDLSNPHDYQKLHFLQAVIIADKAVIKWAQRFADLAREKAETEQDQKRKSELERIAEICDWVPANPARDLWEAIQVVAFIMASVQIETNGVSIGTGRLDQYCLPFYERDIWRRPADQRARHWSSSSACGSSWQSPTASSVSFTPSTITDILSGCRVPIGGQTVRWL